MDKCHFVLHIQNGFLSKSFMEQHVILLWHWVPLNCRSVSVTVVVPEDLYATNADYNLFKLRIQERFSVNRLTATATVRILTPDEYKTEVGVQKHKLYTEW